MGQFGAEIKKVGVSHVKKLIFFQRVMKNFLDLGTYSNRFLVPKNPQVPKINQFGAKIKMLKKLIFLIWGTPHRSSKKFFVTRDLRQSISRARKPPCTKNQPIWRKKNFFRKAYPPLMLKNAYFFNNSKIIIPFLKPLFKSCYSDPILGPYGSFFINFCKI